MHLMGKPEGEAGRATRGTSSVLRTPSPRRGEGKGGQETLRVRVIDWEQPANNDFLLVSQFSVTGARDKCRMTNFDCRTDQTS